jgi:hypothetical protein
MTEVNFGRVENLIIEHGDPQWTPPPRVLRTIRFGKETGARQERILGDFVLKQEHIELLSLFDELGAGTIVRLEIQHGLPMHLLVEQGQLPGRTPGAQSTGGSGPP